MTRAESPLLGRLIFVVGARRSGTNWLSRIIASHPDVVAAPSETYLFAHGMAPLAARFQHGALRSSGIGTIYMHREGLLDALRDFSDAVFAPLLAALDPDARRLVERTPEHVLHLDLIAAVYPDAYLVHIIRDGRDVARSLVQQGWGPANLEEAAQDWRRAVEAGRSARPSERYVEVRYEDLFRAPRDRVAELLTSLGLEVTATILDRALAEAGATFNADPSRPVAVEKWRTELPGGDLDVFDRVAGSTLAELGYPPTPLGSRSDVPPVRRLFQTDRPGWRPFRATGRRTERRRRTEFERLLRTRLRADQRIFERFVHLAAVEKYDELVDLLTPGAQVRIVGPGVDWEGRDEAGRARLVDVLRSDGALVCPQRSGHVHAAVATYVLVASFVRPDGTTVDRVVAVGVSREQVSRVSYYQLPLSAPPATSGRGPEEDGVGDDASIGRI